MITIIKDKNSNHIFAALKICEQLYHDGKIPGRQASISSGSKELRSALESRRVSLGARFYPF